MTLAEWREVHYLIRRLVALEQPATPEDAELYKQQWLALAELNGFEYIVNTWAECHRKLRKEQVAA